MKTFIREVNSFFYPNQEEYSAVETFFALLGLTVFGAMAWLPMLLLWFTW